MSAVDLAPVTTVALADGRVATISRAERDNPRELVLEAHGQDGECVAMAVCELEPSSDAGHVSVSVTAAWRSQGLGRALLSRMVGEAAPLGLRFLVGRHTPADAAAAHMVAGTDGILARRTGEGMVRVAIAVPHAA